MQQLELTEFSAIGTNDCPDCGASFDSEMGLKIHHGKKHDGRLANPTVACANCGVEKRVPSWEVSEYENHFCDSQCKGKWQSENLVAEHNPNYVEHVELVCDHCGDDYEALPRVAPTSRFCSQECQLTGGAHEALRNLLGSDHPSWRGGGDIYHAVRKCIGTKTWEYVAADYRKVAGHKCEWCGTTSEDRALDVHHIVPIRTGGSHHEDNLMALCRSCHSKIERTTDRMFTPILTDGNNDSFD